MAFAHSNKHAENLSRTTTEFAPRVTSMIHVENEIARLAQMKTKPNVVASSAPQTSTRPAVVAKVSGLLDRLPLKFFRKRKAAKETPSLANNPLWKE